MNILHIDCSPRAQSHSRRLSAAILARLVSIDPAAGIIRRDLGWEPLPHAGSDYATALSSPGMREAGLANRAARLSETLIREVEAADVLVIGTPMNNFTVPSVLKAWIDQVVRVGRTFAPSPAGDKIGLLADRPVLVGISSGGIFSGERARQPDFLTPYLSAALGCVGLHTLHFLPLQATSFLGPERLAADQEALLAAVDFSRIIAPLGAPGMPAAGARG